MNAKRCLQKKENFFIQNFEICINQKYFYLYKIFSMNFLKTLFHLVHSAKMKFFQLFFIFFFAFFLPTLIDGLACYKKSECFGNINWPENNGKLNIK